MSHRIVFRAAAVFACVAGLLLAQAPPAAPVPPAEGSPVARQPQLKSAEEQAAVVAILQAQDPDARINAANQLISKFNDSDFKALALFFGAVSYQQKGDSDRMIVYLERTLEADKEHYQAMLMLAGAIAQRTREHDLDREEKLKVAEGYASKALALLKTAPRPRADVTDAQWEAAKRDLSSQAHEAYALAAWARNQPEKAIEEFKTTMSLAGEPDPSTQVRLAAAYAKIGKHDDAIALLDKVIAVPELHPQVKKIAQAERDRTVQLKQKGAAPAK